MQLYSPFLYRRFALIIVLSLSILSCKKQTLPDISGKAYSEINNDIEKSELGRFGPFNVGSYWIYRGVIIRQNDLTGKSDTTVYKIKNEVEGDTVVLQQKCYIIDSYLYYTKEGEYFRYYMNSSVNDVQFVKYLDENKAVGETWRDSVKYKYLDKYNYRITTYTVKEKTDSVIVIREQDVDGILPEFRIYRLGTGLIKYRQPRFFGHHERILTKYKIVN